MRCRVDRRDASDRYALRAISQRGPAAEPELDVVRRQRLLHLGVAAQCDGARLDANGVPDLCIATDFDGRKQHVLIDGLADLDLVQGGGRGSRVKQRGHDNRWYTRDLPHVHHRILPLILPEAMSSTTLPSALLVSRCLR